MLTDCLNEYFFLMDERPNLFSDSVIYPIVTDLETIEKYEKEHNVKIGVIYKSQYHMLIVDLIDGKDGLFTYERIIHTAKGNPVVCIPIVNDKLLLLKQYRHAIRNTQFCFPRGFGEDNLSSADNAQKELFEEIGAAAEECAYIGTVVADSGFISAYCDVFVCKTNEYNPDTHEEGISEIILTDIPSFEKLIENNEINDGFTLSAFSLFKAKILPGQLW